MMFSIDCKRHLPGLGVFVMPIVLVKAATVVLGTSSPQRAEGAAPASALNVAAPRTAVAPLTPQQRAAGAYIATLDAEPFGDVPMLYEPRVEAAAAPVKLDPVEAAPPPLPDAPEFAVQAVMSAASGTRALINSRPYAEGDVVRNTGWAVQKIDVEGLSVTLRELQGARVLTVRVVKHDGM